MSTRDLFGLLDLLSSILIMIISNLNFLNKSRLTIDLLYQTIDLMRRYISHLDWTFTVLFA